MPSPAAHRSAVLGRARAATAWFAAASFAGVGLFSGLAALRHPSSSNSTSGSSAGSSTTVTSPTSGSSDDGSSPTSLSPATTAPSNTFRPAHVSSGGTSHG